MDILGFITLVITGFTSCAEFGSYAFVHPVIRQLPPEHHIRVEQGLLKTFGRVMPVLMTPRADLDRAGYGRSTVPPLTRSPPQSTG
jgi:hypothetical protein